MSDDFSGSDQAGDPVFFQHLIWLIGYPAVWFTLLAWALCIAGAFKLGRLIQGRYGKKGLVVYSLSILAFLAVYAWVLKSAYEVFVQGAAFSDDLVLLSWMSLAVNGLALGSAVWIIADFLRRRKGR